LTFGIKDTQHDKSVIMLRARLGKEFYSIGPTNGDFHFFVGTTSLAGDDWYLIAVYEPAQPERRVFPAMKYQFSSQTTGDTKLERL
jgi:hypothetical protein